ncbi:hypothetical protein KY339_05700 [Candidatus Woesearchaeota archaeon]|nr:hypothetical protein [Candidatus Woesearchaeota archaeon]
MSAIDKFKEFQDLINRLSAEYRANVPDNYYAHTRSIGELEDRLLDIFDTGLMDDEKDRAKECIKEKLFGLGRNYSNAFLMIAFGKELELSLEEEISVPELEQARKLLKKSGVVKDTFDPEHRQMIKYYGIIYDLFKGKDDRLVHEMFRVTQKILDHLPTHYAQVISSMLKESHLPTQSLYNN